MFKFSRLTGAAAALAQGALEHVRRLLTIIMWAIHARRVIG